MYGSGAEMGVGLFGVVETVAVFFDHFSQLLNISEYSFIAIEIFEDQFPLLSGIF